jgi:tetratricopeptide (TPR) repeat protein
VEKANTEHALGDARSAVAPFDRAIALYERLINDEGRPELARDLAATFTSKALAMRARGDRRAAVALHDQAIALYERFVNDEGRRELAPDLAEAYVEKANTEHALGDARSAVALFDRAIALCERLVNDEGRRESADKLARAYMNKGVVEFAVAPCERAMAPFDRAIALYERLVNDEGRPELAPDLAEASVEKANAEYKMAKNRRAVDLYDQAIALYERLVNDGGRRELAGKLARVYMEKAVAVGPDDRPQQGLSEVFIRMEASSSDLEACRPMVAPCDQAIALYTQLVNEDGWRELNRDLRQACALRKTLIELLDNSAAAGDEPHQAWLRKFQLADLERLAKQCSEIMFSRPTRCLVGYKLILTKGGEEQVHEFVAIEEAFIAASPWIMKGYIARVTDKQGIVKYTQALVNGQIATYPGDATNQGAAPASPMSGQIPTIGPRKPWWRFW